MSRRRGRLPVHDSGRCGKPVGRQPRWWHPHRPPNVRRLLEDGDLVGFVADGVCNLAAGHDGRCRRWARPVDEVDRLLTRWRDR